MRLVLALAVLTLLAAAGSAAAAVAPIERDPSTPTLRSRPDAQPLAAAEPPFIASTYRSTIEGKPAKLRTLVSRHMAACTAAGPAQCQIVDMNTSGQPAKYFNASLNLRATPGWAQTLQRGLPADADSIGGALGYSSMRAKDAERDSAAAETDIAIKTVVRDKLRQQLADGDQTADLERVARDLANAERDLRRLRSRVEGPGDRPVMVEMNLSYQTPRPDRNQQPFAYPLKQVKESALGILLASLTIALLCVVALAPWLLVGFGVWFLVRKLRRRKAPDAA